jgi:hypothetical protein
LSPPVESASSRKRRGRDTTEGSANTTFGEQGIDAGKELCSDNESRHGWLIARPKVGVQVIREDKIPVVRIKQPVEFVEV